MWSMLFYRFHSIYDTIKFVPQGVPVFTLLLAPEEWVSPRQSIKGSGVGIYSITISRLSVQSFFIVALPVEPRLHVPWMSMNDFCICKFINKT
jgi:hypothetical protein